jgi:hypothetical protein
MAESFWQGAWIGYLAGSVSLYFAGQIGDYSPDVRAKSGEDED